MRLLALTGALFLLAGCSPGGKVEDFTPATDNARKALVAALDHWKAGNRPGTVPGTAPAVEVLDSKWKAGQKITAYEVLGEDPAGPGPRTFKVRLTPTQGAPLEVRYVVVGIDPLWVYRDEDYKKVSGAGM
jgi:hypothetical protein